MSELNVLFYWTCPHCGLQQAANTHIYSVRTPKHDVVVCGTLAGDEGCGEPSAVTLSIEIVTTVWRLVAAEPVAPL